MPEVPKPESRPWLAAALVARPEGGCAWPEGEIDDQEGFHFCGKAREPGSGSPYCAKHHKVAYLDVGETQEDRDAADAV